MEWGNIPIHDTPVNKIDIIGADIFHGNVDLVQIGRLRTWKYACDPVKVTSFNGRIDDLHDTGGGGCGIIDSERLHLDVDRSAIY
jgi:hypothetical protein